MTGFPVHTNDSGSAWGRCRFCRNGGNIPQPCGTTAIFSRGFPINTVAKTTEICYNVTDYTILWAMMPVLEASL